MRSIVLTLAGVLLAGTAAAQSPGTLDKAKQSGVFTVAYRESSIPFSFLDDKGQPRMTKATLSEQTLALGPAASQVAIKQLGTNGGGFFNVNSAHPFENATPLSNFLELLAILLIPATLCYTFGAMVGDTRQGWAVLAAMTVVFVGLLVVCVVAEQRGATLGSLDRAVDQAERRVVAAQPFAQQLQVAEHGR